MIIYLEITPRRGEQIDAITNRFEQKESIESMKKRYNPRGKFGVDIPEDHCQLLETLAKQRGCKRNRLMREAVKLYLEVQKGTLVESNGFSRV